MSEYISPHDLYQQLEEDDPPVVIDVRGEETYAAGHIPGALHIPGEELPDRLEELPRGRPLVTYRNMRHRGSSRSERAAKLLRESGYQAAALEGGFPAWKRAGFPVDAGIS